MSSDENKKYHLISVEPSSAEGSTDSDVFVQNEDQGLTSSLSEAPAVERENISVEKAVSSSENERAQQEPQVQSALHAQQTQKEQQAQKAQPVSRTQRAQENQQTLHAQQAQQDCAKQDLQDLVQKELDEQIGSDPNVPLANMRVFIIVALLLIIAGFIVYFVFLK